MKRLFIVFFLLMFTVAFAMAQARAGGTMYVATRTADLKSGTGLLSSSTGTLNYGARVTVIRADGRFVEVRCAENSSLTGWIATANLSPRPVVSGDTATVSARETAMAGKGFNQEVETTYREQNRSLNYADVDRVEGISVTEEELRRFLEEGRLKMGE
ncbi:MAG: hypothetical protein LBU88_06310 [Treponema sp.]|jgi:uncharacterized protein YgiM (DUF1202 family)|nr:hypothetical protein [Treponema sp.]